MYYGFCMLIGLVEEKLGRKSLIKRQFKTITPRPIFDCLAKILYHLGTIHKALSSKEEGGVQDKKQKRTSAVFMTSFYCWKGERVSAQNIFGSWQWIQTGWSRIMKLMQNRNIINVHQLKANSSGVYEICGDIFQVLTLMLIVHI